MRGRGEVSGGAPSECKNNLENTYLPGGQDWMLGFPRSKCMKFLEGKVCTGGEQRDASRQVQELFIKSYTCMAVWVSGGGGSVTESNRVR